MATEALLWLALAGLAGWNLKMQFWIAQHHKNCHSQPTAAMAAVEQRVTGCEGELDRLAKNAHDDRSTLSACVLNVARLERR